MLPLTAPLYYKINRNLLLPKPSVKFEKQIHRIYKLLEGCNAEVTWNDKITDPDNSNQIRQIDISIKKRKWGQVHSTYYKGGVYFK